MCTLRVYSDKCLVYTQQNTATSKIEGTSAEREITTQQHIADLLSFIRRQLNQVPLCFKIV